MHVPLAHCPVGEFLSPLVSLCGVTTPRGRGGGVIKLARRSRRNAGETMRGTPPTPSRGDRRRAIEHYRHPSGEPLPGGPLPDSEWQAALSRFNMLEPYGATCYFSFFTESIGWSYHRHNSETSKGECAAACLKTNGCTGFEFPNNAEYCALWYRGNCDSGSSTQKGPVLGAPHLAAAAACPEAHD